MRSRPQGAAAAADAFAGRLWQRAHCRRAASARRKRRKRSRAPASRRLATRTRRSAWRPTTAYGPAATCGASCHRCGRRRGLPQRRRGETQFARGRRRPSHLRDDPLVRRRVSRSARSSWNGRSPCSNPAAMTIWPFASDWTPASPRCFTWRLLCGRSARSSARFRSLTAPAGADRAPSPMSARSRLDECMRPCSN